MKGIRLLSALGMALVVFASTGAFALAAPGDEDTKPQRPAIAGFVQSKHGSDLVVKTRKYKEGSDEVTVHILADTVCKSRPNHEPATDMNCADIKVGSKVMVRGERVGDGSLNAHHIVVGGIVTPPKYRMWAGEIQSIDGNEVSVKNRAGNEYEVYLTPATLILPPDHAPLKVGDKIATFAQWNPTTLEYEALVVILRQGNS